MNVSFVSIAYWSIYVLCLYYICNLNSLLKLFFEVTYRRPCCNKQKEDCSLFSVELPSVLLLTICWLSVLSLRNRVSVPFHLVVLFLILHWKIKLYHFLLSQILCLVFVSFLCNVLFYFPFLSLSTVCSNACYTNLFLLSVTL